MQLYNSFRYNKIIYNLNETTYTNSNRLILSSNDGVLNNNNELPIIIMGDKTVNITSDITPSNRCCGIFIISQKDIIVDATINMTNRGCPGRKNLSIDFNKLFKNQYGVNINLNDDDHHFLNPKLFDKPNMPNYITVFEKKIMWQKNFSASTGGRGPSYYQAKTVGAWGNKPVGAGAGGRGTIFSGGSGGTAGSNAEDAGGAGGSGATVNTDCGARRFSGGAGNPGGAGPNAGGTGTGGSIFLIAKKNIIINGTLRSNGANGGNGYIGSCQGLVTFTQQGFAGGGAGGGYIFLAFGGKLEIKGTINNTGGSPGAYTMDAQPGGTGLIHKFNINSGLFT